MNDSKKLTLSSQPIFPTSREKYNRLGANENFRSTLSLFLGILLSKCNQYQIFSWCLEKIFGYLPHQISKWHDYRAVSRQSNFYPSLRTVISIRQIDKSWQVFFEFSILLRRWSQLWFAVFRFGFFFSLCKGLEPSLKINLDLVTTKIDNSDIFDKELCERRHVVINFKVAQTFPKNYHLPYRVAWLLTNLICAMNFCT